MKGVHFMKENLLKGKKVLALVLVLVMAISIFVDTGLKFVRAYEEDSVISGMEDSSLDSEIVGEEADTPEDS